MNTDTTFDSTLAFERIFCEFIAIDNDVVLTSDQSDSYIPLLQAKLKADLEEGLRWMEDDWHRDSIKHIFVEDRMYRVLEDSEKTWQEQFDTILTQMKQHESLLHRPICESDIEKLLETEIADLAEYDVREVGKRIQRLKEQMTECRGELEDIERYTSDWLSFHHLAGVEGADAEGRVGKIIFGVSESVANVRAFYKDPDTGLLETRTEALYRAVRRAGATTLTVMLFTGQMKHVYQYTPKGQNSSSEPEDTPPGILLRCERARQENAPLRDPDAFREVVGPVANLLLLKDSPRPNVFLNVEPLNLA